MADSGNIRSKAVDIGHRFCIIDVGSTTTKAILFIKGDDWAMYREEAPTTVEKPDEDVTVGVIRALRRLEETSGERLLDGDTPALPCLSTSSAGGGLAMVVAGLIREVTSRSAERVALGAGAVIQDILAFNDGRSPYKKITILKNRRPDIILLAGGFDGGSVHGPVFMAELINQAALRPKLKRGGRLPVIYAGNNDADEYVGRTLEKIYHFHAVPNLRPANRRENLEPARDAIHDLFMDHVMSRAPGYDKYRHWISGTILPTPAAFGKILGLVSKEMKQRLLAIDIGGATTDVFTAENGNVFRTVSANLGMSYSLLNVARQAGIDKIRELLDLDIDENDLYDRIGNKYINPTSLAATLTDTKVECAAAAVAIREAVRDHFRVRRGVALSRSEEELGWNYLKRRGQKKKSAGDALPLDGYDMIIGSGGRLSHSPRDTAAMILINGLQPGGIIDLAVDSVFMFPHLGALSQINPELALEFFYRFGLVRLGKLVAPTGRPGKRPASIKISGPEESIPGGAVRVDSERVVFIDMPGLSPAWLNLKPSGLKLSVKKIELTPEQRCLIVDTRGRPGCLRSDFALPDNFQPVIPRLAAPPAPAMSAGDISEMRELAVPGEVLVRIGDHPESDTVIAKSTRAFLRPFFLRIADYLKVTPDRLGDYFHKGVGDRIELGEVLARKTTRILETKEFKSPVTGVVEKTLPDGTVVIREEQEFSDRTCAVKLTEILDLEPHKIRPLIRVQPEQEVEKGQILAATPLGQTDRRGRPLRCVSPVRGKITSVDFNRALIIIEPLLEELELTAWLPGRVDEITDRGCRLSGRGLRINGVWGSGGRTAGLLAEYPGTADSIVYCPVADSRILEKLRETCPAGLITGSIRLADYYRLDPAYVIVVTAGFGRKEASAELDRALTGSYGRQVLLDGTTQLRAGVIRPRIIIPDIRG